MKTTEQYFHVVLFIMFYKVVLTCKSLDDGDGGESPLEQFQIEKKSFLIFNIR